MKIYTKIVYQYNAANDDYTLIESADFDYTGNLALCGGGQQSSGDTSGTTTTVSQPWSAQIPYLTKGFQTADNLFFNQQPQYYPGQTVTPFSPEKQTAVDLQALRATQGSPLQPLSDVQSLATMGGAYLPGNNPFATTLNQDYDSAGNSASFNNAVQAAQHAIIPAVDSAFERSGQLNSGLAQAAKTQALSDSFANLYEQDKGLMAQDRSMRGQNYTNERQNMMLSMLNAPQLAAADYNDFTQLGNAGDMQDALSQQYNQEAIDRYNYSQNLPESQLQQYMQLISGNYGQTSSSTTSGSNDSLSRSSGGVGNALGGALTGYSLASKIAGVNPLLGAGVGLLGGIF